ncbi:MAG: hypothetical protein K2X82_33120 [Gemmataceae bacterium]|nr:hypothetical protein [Gemmataceae bacterium]
MTAGWLELAEEQEPGTPKGLLEELDRVYLPDGTMFVAVSYPTAHRAVDQALTPWARQSGRSFGLIEGEAFVLNDGRAFPLAEVRFTRRP